MATNLSNEFAEVFITTNTRGTLTSVFAETFIYALPKGALTSMFAEVFLDPAQQVNESRISNIFAEAYTYEVTEEPPASGSLSGSIFLSLQGMRLAQFESITGRKVLKKNSFYM